MIVWLASYPRSGNTLLQTILHTTMHFPSYPDESPPQKKILSNARVEEIVGHQKIDVSWTHFYAKMSEQPGIVLVKTHRPPRDLQPAIYIVRDGRCAIASYLAYHQTYYPEAQKNIVQLILGDDVYGDWSSHFIVWQRRQNAPLLLVRFEQLVHCSDVLLRKIAAFTQYDDEPEQWKNPFAELHREKPGSFRQGETRWQAPSYWNDDLNALFFAVHGDLMIRLGYVSEDEVSRALERVNGQALESIASIARETICAKQSIEKDCQEKQRVIEELHHECVKRLELIQTLEKDCQEKQRMIEELHHECVKGLELIQILEKDCQEKQRQLASTHLEGGLHHFLPHWLCQFLKPKKEAR